MAYIENIKGMQKYYLTHVNKGGMMDFFWKENNLRSKISGDFIPSMKCSN
jgi:hypothetical protein